MKTLVILILSAITFASLTANAQKGNNQIQLSGQVNFPTSELSDAAKTGFGFAAKGLYGFGNKPQQLTLEAGYNDFGVKNVPSGINASYSAVPLYLGYRYNMNRFNLESQAGLSINKISATASVQDVSDTRSTFAWALGLGYNLRNIELGIRYQSSEDGDDDVTNGDISFVGIRIGYMFSLK